jgi:PGF-CTERM protein
MYCESEGATYTASTDSCGYGMAVSAWVTSVATGGSTIYVDYGDDKFYMNSAMSPAETLAAMIAEDEDDMEDDMDDDDDEWGMVDPSQIDWSTANFTSTIELEGTEVMFVFSTELTVDDVVQTITIHVDQNLEVRVFDLVSDEGDMTITSFTDAQIAELMNIDTSTFTEQEALPFTVGYGESFDTLVHEESNDEMTMIWDCQYFTNESTPVENGNWDSLDDSMCGEVVDTTIEIDETYVGDIGMPQAFNMADEEEGMLISISNDMIISMTMSDYSVMTGDSTGMWCEEEGGTYDASADTCSMVIGEIMAYDDMYMEVQTEEGDEFTHYQYDANAQSGFIASPMYGYTCHDGEVIDAEWVNDGWEDCADGSDEFEESVDNTYWDCNEIVDLGMMMEDWLETNLDTSICGSDYTEPTIDSTYTGTINLPEYWSMDDYGPMYWVDETEMFVMTAYSNSEDPNGVDCENNGGTYDAEEDLCTLAIAEIMQYDDQYMKVYDYESSEDLYVYYSYDEGTGSGILALPWDDSFDWDELTFICGNGDEILFSWVNDGMDDCEDGSDEQQYDENGNPINWFECEDESHIWINEVNDGYPDCANGEDEWNDDEEHYDDETAWNCDRFISGSMWTTAGFEDWDESNLITSMCDELISEEFWMDFELTSEESTLPMSWYMFMDDEEELLAFVEIVEEDDSTMYLYATIGEWSVYADAMYCEGDYDATNDECTMEMGEVIGSDDMFIVFYDSWDDEEIIIMYQYDDSTGSGIFAVAEEYEEMFLCDSGDQSIPMDWVNDGVEDCDDGSDEYEYEGDGIETNLWWDGEDLMWELEYDTDGDFNDVVILVYDEEDTEVMSYNEADVSYVEISGNSFSDGCYYAQAISYLSMDEWLIMSEEWWCVGDNEWEEEGKTYDFMVHAENSDMMAYAGDLNDYNAVLALCEGEYVESTDEYEYLCTDSSVSVSLVDAMAEGGSMGVFFFDSDDSGTLTEGDYFTVSDDVNVDWNTVRLFSNSAQAYSDENPLSESVPGFTALMTVIGLLGAVLIRKNE